QRDDFKIQVPINSTSTKINVPLSLSPYTSSEINITTINTGSDTCQTEGDERTFAAKISNINWVEN
ncbi:MAG: hypothetical protein WAO29_00765, partial [Candidatus Nanopelagicales bacterium]